MKCELKTLHLHFFFAAGAQQFVFPFFFLQTVAGKKEVVQGKSVIVADGLYACRFHFHGNTSLLSAFFCISSSFPVESVRRPDFPGDIRHTLFLEKCSNRFPVFHFYVV